ncbi:DM13 domain-containing protein [Hoeflea prorocentri]|uniref:DM13 domain-containing protein n=1 Tax=Hoeflea prorocentri TaxID=1922333 RepID=A0A9X3UK95_9HYPH|nr:DM13 domain-containing protein [Hoeflea prorocentri]MCY6382121.1 DM13 domain-containing protein [Hoeflea prorocentri]MDA5399921.1 DM13 domain-containing protein [Hoeflea prorocentri]
MRRLILLLISHGAVLAIGFALGIYLLPIITAPPSPDAAVLEERAQAAQFSAEFTRDLRGSDFLHWGEGKISLTPDQIVHEGRLAPGPDYKVYLVDRFVEHEDEFLPVKAASPLIGDVKSFEGFLINIPEDIDITQYTTVLTWCETFGEFITAAKYR